MRSSRLIAAAGLAAVVALPAGAQERRAQETLFDQSYSVSAGQRLVVGVDDMDLDIRTGGGSEARVTVTAYARDLAFARDVFERMDFEASAGGGDLRVVTRAEDRDYDWREWRERGGADFVATITVPRRFDLEVRTGDGDIRIGTIEGVASIQTGDGDVTLEGIAGPRVSLRTGDGDVAAGVVEATEIELRTGDGDLRFDRLVGSVRASTGDGDLALRGVEGDVTASTGDGDVEIDIARFDGLSVRTGDGDVVILADPSIRAEVDIEGSDLELGEAFTLTGRLYDHRLSGTLNGGGPRLSVRTGEGSVTIRSR